MSLSLQILLLLANVIAQALATSKAGSTQGLAEAFPSFVVKGGDAAAQALSSGYADAVNAGKTATVAQAIASASALVSNHHLPGCRSCEGQHMHADG